MRRPVKARHLPARIAVGSYVLAAGLSKRTADEEAAARLHGMAKSAYPFLDRIPPRDFHRLLVAGEITVGAALLLPVVPTVLAGAGLAAFSGGLVGLYLRAPGLRRPGSLLWTQQGTGVAKDVWMFGVALGFLVDELTSREN